MFPKDLIMKKKEFKTTTDIKLSEFYTKVLIFVKCSNFDVKLISSVSN